MQHPVDSRPKIFTDVPQTIIDSSVPKVQEMSFYPTFSSRKVHKYGCILSIKLSDQVAKILQVHFSSIQTDAYEISYKYHRMI